MVALGLFLAMPPMAAAQDQPQIAMHVLVLDTNTLFEQSLFAQSLRAEVVAKGAAANVEFERLSNELAEEEQQLVALRETLSAEDFAQRAEAFDAKVTETHAARERTERELQAELERTRVVFFERIRPILASIMVEKGGAVILNSDQVFLRFNQVVITQEAIERVDKAFPTAINGAPQSTDN